MFFVELEEGGPMILRDEIGDPQPALEDFSPNGSEGSVRTVMDGPRSNIAAV